MYNVCHLSAVYCHPAEYLFGNTLPSMMSLLILKSNVHVICFAGWIIFRLIETHEGHSGLEFPVSPFSVIPFNTGATYHDYHHLKNQGNYSSFMSLWDQIFGTNQPFLENEQLKVKAD